MSRRRNAKDDRGGQRPRPSPRVVLPVAAVAVGAALFLAASTQPASDLLGGPSDTSARIVGQLTGRRAPPLTRQLPTLGRGMLPPPPLTLPKPPAPRSAAPTQARRSTSQPTDVRTTPTEPAPKPTSHPSCAQALADGTYYIDNSHSGDVIDIPGSDTTEGIVLDQWPLNRGRNQQWQITSVSCGVYKIISVEDGQAVDIHGSSTSEGASVDQWPYSAGRNQQFRITKSSSGAFTITNINSDEVVEVPGSSTTNGTSLDQWSANGGWNQQWTFSPA
jgi:hypothetical protein